MPRRARLSVPGVAWHIIQRGNNRSACFYTEHDYRRYLECLTELSRRFECSVHAYVLMTNHVHLLLTPAQMDSVALLMKHLGQRYVQYINRTYRRSGTLWEGRFRSCLAQSEDYVLACYRYIELNPVRAAMVEHPGDYHWSSYSGNAGDRSQLLLTPHPQYMALGTTEVSRKQAYRGLFKAQLDELVLGEIRQATNGNYVLGNRRFRAQIRQVLQRQVAWGEPRRSGEG